MIVAKPAPFWGVLDRVRAGQGVCWTGCVLDGDLSVTKKKKRLGLPKRSI
jgi:hypothetical protein